jgi:hypothetical protein
MSPIPLPRNFKSIEDLINENPQMKTFAKYFNTRDFVPLGFVVVSQPQSHPDHTIYGLFVLNKQGVGENVRAGIHKKPELKQDFIALDRLSNRAVYYSGGSRANTGSHQSIKSFCKTYGQFPDGGWNQYGCARNLMTDQHWYADENDTRLPAEPAIRNLIQNELVKFRRTINKRKRIKSRKFLFSLFSHFP